MLLKFLGTGTSQGIPVIGCHCHVCQSKNTKDNRLRASAIIQTDSDYKILIDCGPDFRQQMLLQKEEKVDAVLFTHEHNDHIIGLDDMRPIIFKYKRDIPLYGQQRVLDEIKSRFSYAFAEDKYPGAPSFETHTIENEFSLLDTSIQPIKINHGNLPILGYRIENLAYLTDVKSIDTSEKEKLKNLDYLIINCLRKEPHHHSHMVLDEVLELCQEIEPKKTYITHISHHFGTDDEINDMLPNRISTAYDGLEISF